MNLLSHSSLVYPSRQLTHTIDEHSPLRGYLHFFGRDDNGANVSWGLFYFEHASTQPTHSGLSLWHSPVPGESELEVCTLPRGRRPSVGACAYAKYLVSSCTSSCLRAGRKGVACNSLTVLCSPRFAATEERHVEHVKTALSAHVGPGALADPLHELELIVTFQASGSGGSHCDSCDNFSLMHLQAEDETQRKTLRASHSYIIDDIVGQGEAGVALSVTWHLDSSHDTVTRNSV